MALPLWKHPSPFTAGFSRRKCGPQALRAQPACSSAPRAPVLSRWLRLDSSTLDGLTYLHVLLTPQNNDGGQKACDVEVVRRNLERLYYLETPHSVVKDGRGACEPLWLDISHMALQLNDPPARSGTGPPDDSNEYFANRGEAIRLLRDELPCLFTQDLSYHIYSDTVILRDIPRMFEFQGLEKYKAAFRGIRMAGNLLFYNLQFEIQAFSISPFDSNDVRMKWRVTGVPRWQLWGGDPSSWDGKSTLRFDKRGKINLHEIDDKEIRNFWRSLPLWTRWLRYFEPAPEPTGGLCPNFQPGAAVTAAFLAWQTSAAQEVQDRWKGMQDAFPAQDGAGQPHRCALPTLAEGPPLQGSF